VGEVVRRQFGIGRCDRRLDRRPGNRRVVGLADVERDRRSLPFDEQPARAAQELGHAPGQALGRCVGRLVAGSERGRDAARAGTARVGPGLQPVVAEIGDPADPGPGGHVGRGPAGQHDDRHAVRSRGRDRGQPSQGSLGERDDARRARIARRNRERAVEVGHDEESPRAGGQAAHERRRP
jgi:hypothetical protein